MATDEQIGALAEEAAAAGDERMRRICLAALGDESWAEAVGLTIETCRRACAEAIDEAAAARGSK